MCAAAEQRARAMRGLLPPPAALPPPPRRRRCRRPRRARALAVALALALLACCARVCVAKGTAVNKAAHKLHRGKHRAASRHDRKAALGVSLLKATGGMCHYMEADAFEETFTEELNVSRWDPRSLDGLFHCNRGTDEYVRPRRVVSGKSACWDACLPPARRAPSSRARRARRTLDACARARVPRAR
jgi:hypothetical protein